MKTRIAVLLPCYNEALTIAKTVADFRAALPDATIYVFDNASTDDSVALAEGAGATVIPVPQRGKGNVVRMMFRLIDADVYVMVDADDTYPAQEVEKLILPIMQRKADMVAGDRLSTTYYKENTRPGHNFGNALVCFLVSLLWDKKVKDVMTGYRAFSRSFVKNCPVMSQGFEIETEITLHALDKRFSLLEVPIAYRDRPTGSFSKLNTFKDGIKVLGVIFNMFRIYRPLPFFGGLGSFFLLIGCIFLIPVFVDYFRTGLVPRFPTLIFSTFLLLTGMLSWVMGLILDAIKKMSDREYELRLMDNCENVDAQAGENGTEQ
jgi:glycosyltransferase involved in cell wall biosynthesis